MTFFALVIGAVQPSDPGTERCRCDASPFRKKQVACTSSTLSYATDVSVLLTYHKVQDSVQDETGYKRFAARLLRRLMRKAYAKAQAALPALDNTMRACLDDLTALEQAKTPSLDRPADTFARLLAAAVQRIIRQTFSESYPRCFIILEDGFIYWTRAPMSKMILRPALITPSCCDINYRRRDRLGEAAAGAHLRAITARHPHRISALTPVS